MIWVDPDWVMHPAIQELKAQGHDIRDREELFTTPDAPCTPDLILSRAAHGWDDTLWKLLPVALTAARARRKKRD